MKKWTAERANLWHEQQGWICGFNFLPSSSVNFLEMWMSETFDRKTIETEMAWASLAGFNAVRTNFHDLIWKNDRDGLFKRFDWFLELAAKLNIRVMPVLFDDCGFGGFEPQYGPQPDPIAGTHNSQAVACPGRERVKDRTLHPHYKKYVQDFIQTFADDERILLWDLYNEPGNGMVFNPNNNPGETELDFATESMELMRLCFDWAREVNPIHPLTVGAWRSGAPDENCKLFDNEIDQLALELSDVISFHAYCPLDKVSMIIDELSQFSRPMLNTEWMARPVGSRVHDQLPLYFGKNVGCFIWGMVQGRTQTHIPWPHLNLPKSEEWFHDIFQPNGEPFDATEIDVFRRHSKL